MTTEIERIIKQSDNFILADRVAWLTKAIEQYVQDKLKTEASLWKLAMAEKESEREQYVIKAKEQSLINYKRLEKSHSELESKWNEAHKQVVIKARIEVHQEWRDWAKQPTGDCGISIMHSAGISSAVTEIHERADKEIAELKKGLK